LNFGVIVVRGPAAVIVVTAGDGQKLSVDAEIGVTVRVTDAGGNSIDGAPVIFSTGSSGGSVTDSLQTTRDGYASVTHWRLGSALGTYTLTASTGTLHVTASVAVVSGPPAFITRVAGDSQRVSAGGGVFQPASVQVSDASGRPVPLAPVSWSATFGGIAVDACRVAQQVTNSLGTAFCDYWRVPQPGRFPLVATSGPLSTTFELTGLPRPSTIAFVNAPDSTTSLHTSTFFPNDIVVQVNLPDGAPAVGYGVRFSGYAGALNDNSTVTDASGRAAGRWRIADDPGRASFTVSVDNVLFTSTSIRAFGPLRFYRLTGGDSHTCGTAQNRVYCWGSNVVGQVGDGSGGRNRTSPSPIAFGQHSDNSYLGSVGDHTCLNIITDYGRSGSREESTCWGLAPDGTAILPTPVTQPVGAYQIPGLTFPAPVLTYPYENERIFLKGAPHVCVVRYGAVGNVSTTYCAGRNDFGQLGDGTTASRTNAMSVLGGLSFESISVGANHSCGRTTSGAGYCWGRNDAGQLGDGTTISRSSPVMVAGGLAILSVVAGEAHTCALTVSRDAYCWGANTFRQLGTGATGSNVTSPRLVIGGNRFWFLAAGSNLNCGAQKVSTTYFPSAPVLCWGRNTDGQLGDGTTINRSTPVPLADYHP
jgi:hypothetical protein